MLPPRSAIIDKIMGRQSGAPVGLRLRRLRPYGVRITDITDEGYRWFADLVPPRGPGAVSAKEHTPRLLAATMICRAAWQRLAPQHTIRIRSVQMNGIRPSETASHGWMEIRPSDLLGLPDPFRGRSTQRETRWTWHDNEDRPVCHIDVTLTIAGNG